MQKIILRSLFVAFVLIAVSTVISVAPAVAQVAVGISVGFGPPAIPVYDQPACPGDGYYWTPGYWAWDADVNDYYWVPGTWVEPPDAGLLWTPGYWGWNDTAFVWTDGYWGPTIGFYGGINYGFGYFGDGFVGGRWDGGHFYYNSAVWHVDRSVVHNVYENRVTIVNNNHVSFNGGNGGVMARASAEQEAARNERHVEAVAAQRQQMDAARGNQQLRASANHGKPPIAATEKAGAFNDHVVKAKDAGGTYNPPANRGNVAANNPRGENNSNAERNEVRTNDAARTNEPNAMTTNRPSQSNNSYVHPKDLPAYEKPAAPNTGNPKTDQKYQQQQEKLAQQQDKERQKLQSQQDKEHQQYSKQQADEAKNQALEQKHTQQTQQLQQRQQAAQQHLQQRQAPAHAAAPSGGHAEEPKK
jgi:WXXGXW repeat (2 copies)